MIIEQTLCGPRISSILSMRSRPTMYNIGQKKGDKLLFEFNNPKCYIILESNPYGKAERYLVVLDDVGFNTENKIRCYVKEGDILRINDQEFLVEDLELMGKNLDIELNLETI